MARPCKPLALLISNGATTVNPARFADRIEPDNLPPLIAPTACLDAMEQECFAWFARTFYWLSESDRPIVEMASRLRVKFLAGIATPAEQTLLKQCLTEICGSPSSRSKIPAPKTERAKNRFAS